MENVNQTSKLEKIVSENKVARTATCVLCMTIFPLIYLIGSTLVNLI